MNTLGMRLLLSVFFLIGMGMATVDYFLLKGHFNFIRFAALATGEVIGYQSSRGKKGASMHAPKVRFSVPLAEGGQGESFEIIGSVRSNSRGYDLGDSVPVMYLPDDPQSARIKSFLEQWFAILIVSMFALIFNGIWVAFAVNAVFKWRLQAWLEQHGQTIQADVSQILRNSTFQVNGRSPWRVSAHWTHPRTGTTHILSSEHLWQDPTMAMRDRRQVGVRIDANDPRRHRMDLSFLE